ncbi:integral membrane protein [Colletotrichum kahawae]|uniref:Integral membrane protein n=1 Tax=Colletotrichum kahawae TaxID=34407 RepID=A0AAE0DBT1_COLKA|nr:integral membrane protein [Colletotrichum kahawae]
MADPLSIAASVAGLVTLAASTAKLAKTLSDRYNEKAAASIRGNVETLDSALIRINRSLEHQAFDHPGEDALRQPIESCARTLRNIEIQFQKLEIKGYSWQSIRERIARPEVLREISTLQVMLEGQKITLLIAMHYLVIWREHRLIMANRNCTGESQSKMLHMIFRAIEELRTTIDRERPVNTPFQNNSYSILTNLTRADVGYEITPSVVHAHPSFDDWLSTWATTDDPGGQPTSSTDESTKGGHLNPESDIASSRPQNVKLIIEGLPQSAQKGTATREITTPANTPLYDIMFQLDKESLQIPRRYRSDNLQGSGRICGFAIVENGAKVAPFMPWSTSFVVVTQGPSCYDVQSGLKINRNESLIHFYNGCVRRLLDNAGAGQPVVEKLQSSIVIRNTSAPERAASVTFQRTLRLPEWSGQTQRPRSTSRSLMYGKAQGISEFLGPFPLFDTEAYGERLPKEMKEKGGLFFPIFQREALAFSFENISKGRSRTWEEKDDKQFAIKVYSGSINCVSGQQVNDYSVPREQDYIIYPTQKRLDGFKSADNETRQFVAMPLGWEYSAEQQLTDKEDVGGIQLQIAPRLRDCVEFRALDHLWNLGWSFRCSATASELGLAAGSVIAMSDFDPDIKLLNEFEHSFADRSRWQIHGRSSPLLYPMDETGLHRVTTVQDLLQRTGSQNLGATSSIRLQPVLSVAIRLEFTVGSESRQSSERKFDTSFSCSPFLDFGLLASQCLHGHGIKCGRCESCETSKVFSSPPVWQFALLGKEPFMYDWPPKYHPVEAVIAESGALYGDIHLYCTLYRAGIPYIHPPPFIDSHTDRFWGSYPQAPSPAGWEMALGAGARLLQEIHIGKELTWDWDNSCLVNIQLLNAAAFRSVTGIPAWTPISLLDYRKKKLLLQVPVAVNGTCDAAAQVSECGLKSISTLDIALSDDVKHQRRIVTCPQCETNMCNVA